MRSSLLTPGGEEKGTGSGRDAGRPRELESEIQCFHFVLSGPKLAFTVSAARQGQRRPLNIILATTFDSCEEVPPRRRFARVLDWQ